MEILKYAVLFITLVVYVGAALAVRNDPRNENQAATVLLCVSMAGLMCVKWF